MPLPATTPQTSQDGRVGGWRGGVLISCRSGRFYRGFPRGSFRVDHG
jgi:hypothetical protein